MGEPTETLALGLAVLALAIGLVCLIMMARMRHRVEAVTPDMRRLTRRLRRTSGAGALSELLSSIEGLSQKLEGLGGELTSLRASYDTTVQKVGLVRFNIDDSMSGNLSFALAVLDAKSTGFIIVSLHSLEGSRVYAREVMEGRAERELLSEEKQALEIAVGEARRETTGSASASGDPR